MKEYYKMIAIDLNEQQAFDSDPKAILQINFTANLATDAGTNTIMLFIIEEVKQNHFRFSKRNPENIVTLFSL